MGQKIQRKFLKTKNKMEWRITKKTDMKALEKV